MNPLAFEHFDIGQLARLLFHDDGGKRAPGKNGDEKQTDDEFSAHKEPPWTKSAVLIFSTPICEQFIRTRLTRPVGD
jgi:hypothetical protein